MGTVDHSIPTLSLKTKTNTINKIEHRKIEKTITKKHVFEFVLKAIPLLSEVHDAISVLAYYSPIFIIGSLTAYLVSQRFDVWFFHYLKNLTDGRKLWLRNNLSTIASQLIDTFIYQFTWVLATGMTFSQAFGLAAIKYVFKVLIALIDTIFIYWVKDWEIKT